MNANTALCRAFGSDSAAQRWQRQHSSAAAEQGVGSGSAAAGSAERWKRQRSSGQCRLWQHCGGSTVAASLTAAAQRRQRSGRHSHRQCRALAAAAQPQLQCRACAVQGLWPAQGVGSCSTARQRSGGSIGRWQRRQRSCSAGRLQRQRYWIMLWV